MSDIFSPFFVTIQSVQTVNGCHQINFFLQQMKLLMRNVILNRENKLSDVSCDVLFYCLIKFNHKILILSRFVTKNDFSYVIITTDLCIKYFCNIKLCLREDMMTKYLLSTKKWLVLKYCFMFIVFSGLYTSSRCSRAGP
jgi:hypothetical protein